MSVPEHIYIYLYGHTLFIDDLENLYTNTPDDYGHAQNSLGL